MYHMHGMMYSDIEDMPRMERQAFLRLLVEQKNFEKDEHERAQQDAQGRGKEQMGGGSMMREPLPGEEYGKSSEQILEKPIARMTYREQKRQEYERRVDNEKRPSGKR